MCARLVKHTIGVLPCQCSGTLEYMDARALPAYRLWPRIVVVVVVVVEGQSMALHSPVALFTRLHEEGAPSEGNLHRVH